MRLASGLVILGAFLAEAAIATSDLAALNLKGQAALTFDERRVGLLALMGVLALCGVTALQTAYGRTRQEPSASFSRPTRPVPGCGTRKEK